jgi:hypothetical protein
MDPAEGGLQESTAVEAALGIRGLEVDDDLVLVDLLNDRAYRLNPTGGLIWKLIQSRRTIGELTEEVARAYGLGPDETAGLAREYVGQLVELGLASTDGEQITQR